MNTTGQVMPNGDTVYYEDSKARDMFADAYDSTKSYAVGNHCIKDDVLYVCNTAIPSGGETWNSAHWTATTYDAEVSALKSNLDGLTPIQRGRKASVSLAASAYTEVQINLDTAFSSSDDYIAIATVVVWADPSKFSCIVRNKSQGSFTLRVYNANTSAVSVDIDWIVMHV